MCAAMAGRILRPVRAPQTPLPPEDGTMLARWTVALLERELSEEAERVAVLARHGVSLEALLADDARLSHGTACAIWEELTADHSNPLLGVRFASELSEADLGIVAYLAKSCETPLAGLRRVERYYRLLKSPGAMSLLEDGERVQIVDRPPAGLRPWPRHFAEAVIYTYKELVERWTGKRLAIERVRFQHAAPREAARVEHAFGTEVSFGSADNALVVKRSHLEVGLLPHDPALQRYLVPSAESLLERLPRGDDLLSALEIAILAALPSGSVTIERMARELGVGVRTLQRRLRSRSKTFQEVVDAVRRSASERVSAKPGLSMKEAAFLLGFADPKSLRRAKDRWQRRES